MAVATPLLPTALDQYWIIYYRTFALIIQCLVLPQQREQHGLEKNLAPEYLAYPIYQTEKKSILSGYKNSIVLYLQFVGHSLSWKVFAKAQLYIETSYLSEDINNCRKFGICC